MGNKMSKVELVLEMGISLCLGALGGMYLYSISDRAIPNEKGVRQGYIAPSELEIYCQDLDKDGEKETIMTIRDKPYLLREINGKPVLSAYGIKPAEIKYKTE